MKSGGNQQNRQNQQEERTSDAFHPQLVLWYGNVDGALM
jgi:hypothetical protein